MNLHSQIMSLRLQFDAELEEAKKDAYAEGRKDEREEMTRLLAWAYGKLVYRSFDSMDDAIAMDEIKLFLTGPTS